MRGRLLWLVASLAAILSPAAAAQVPPEPAVRFEPRTGDGHVPVGEWFTFPFSASVDCNGLELANPTTRVDFFAQLDENRTVAVAFPDRVAQNYSVDDCAPGRTPVFSTTAFSYLFWTWTAFEEGTLRFGANVTKDATHKYGPYWKDVKVRANYTVDVRPFSSNFFYESARPGENLSVQLFYSLARNGPTRLVVTGEAKGFGWTDDRKTLADLAFAKADHLFGTGSTEELDLSFKAPRAKGVHKIQVRFSAAYDGTPAWASMNDTATTNITIEVQSAIDAVPGFGGLVVVSVFALAAVWWRRRLTA